MSQVHTTAPPVLPLVTYCRDGSVPPLAKARACRRRSTASLVRSGVAGFLL